MASSLDLALDCKPHSYSMLLKSFGDQQTDHHTQKLEEFLSHLEDERIKIDAFKRELPLSMQLLSNAVEVSRQQLQSYVTNHEPKPVLEEFMPLNNSNSKSQEEKASMINWMTCAQLCSKEGNQTKPLQPMTPSKETGIAREERADREVPETEIGLGISPKLTLDTKQVNGGAFIPFSRERRRYLPEPVNSGNGTKETSGKVAESHIVIETNGNANKNQIDLQVTNSTTGNGNNQPPRKSRRCWSPELHRRFVNALHMLGGSQVSVATPKQIRELMNVEGLTNDEVKSHLQKYRLHTRRPSQSPHTIGGPAQHLVVLGGIWVPPEYGATRFCASPMPHNFYTAAAATTVPVSSPQQQHHLHQVRMYKAAAQAESDLRRDADRWESIEDGKSEDSSLKGDSVGNGNGSAEGKGLAALRENGEESNGSTEITLSSR